MHTSGHTPWGFTSRSGRITSTVTSIATTVTSPGTIASVSTSITTVITSIATAVTSPATIASVSTSITTVITSIATAPLASGSTPLAGTSTITSTATAAHHVHLTRIHATGELRFGSHFFHFHFMTVNVYCAFFEKFFRHIFSFICDEAEVFAFTFHLVEGLFNVGDGTEGGHVIFDVIITEVGGKFTNVYFSLLSLGFFNCNFFVLNVVFGL